MPALGQSVEGVGNVNGVLPPDTNGDVGPNHFVQWVNLSFAVYSKGTSTTPPALLYGPAPANTIWSGFGGPCETRNDGDPIVEVRPHGRSLGDEPARHPQLVPRTSLRSVLPVHRRLGDPRSARRLLSLPVLVHQAERLSQDGCLVGRLLHDDEPVLRDLAAVGGAGRRGVRSREDARRPAGRGHLLRSRGGGHESRPACCRPISTGRSRLRVLPRTSSRWTTMRGARRRINCRSGSSMPTGRARLSRRLRASPALPTAPFDSDMCGYARNCIPQPGHDRQGRRDVRSLDVPPAVSQLRHARNAGRQPDRRRGRHRSRRASAGTRSAIPGPPRSSISRAPMRRISDHRWMGSAAMDSAGNMALGFSVSGAATFPSIRYTGRLAADPPNVMTLGEADLMVGTGIAAAHVRALGRLQLARRRSRGRLHVLVYAGVLRGDERSRLADADRIVLTARTANRIVAVRPAGRDHRGLDTHCEPKQVRPTAPLPSAEPATRRFR